MAFFKHRKNHSESYKAVFSASIDFNYNYNDTNEHRKPLKRSGKDFLGKEERHTTYDDLQDLAIGIINNELQEECEKFIDLPISDIKVKGVFEGSIELFFIVSFGVLAGVTGFKDLYDSIEFIRILAEKKLQKRFKEKYDDCFNIDVKCQIPRDVRYWNEFDKKHLISTNSARDTQQKRDAFFYYLFASNIILLLVVIALVFNAVAKMYF